MMHRGGGTAGLARHDLDALLADRIGFPRTLQPEDHLRLAWLACGDGKPLRSGGPHTLGPAAASDLRHCHRARGVDGPLVPGGPGSGQLDRRRVPNLDLDRLALRFHGDASSLACMPTTIWSP